MGDKVSELIAKARAVLEKEAFTPVGPGGPMPPAGGMPPGGAPPMDPSMMGGGMPPPGAPPMDPSMMGGGMPPPGAPPMDPMAAGGGTPVMLTLEDLIQVFQMAAGGGAPGAPEGEAPPEGGAPNEPKPPEGGKGRSVEGKLEDLSAQVQQLTDMVTQMMGPMAGPEAGMAGGMPLDSSLGGAAPVPPQEMGVAAPLPAGGGAEFAPPMQVQASAKEPIKTASKKPVGRDQLVRVIKNLRSR